jgi:glycosyltransferase involved in cell wall biosynthesis
MIETTTTQIQLAPHRDEDSSQTSNPLTITVVIPIANQRDMIATRYSAVRAALQDRLYEIIAVDDGSSDDSFAVLRGLAADDPALRVVRLRRGFGRSAALSAGFSRARGAAIVTLDVDGQTDADDIPRLLAEIEHGFDVVSGWRRGARQPLRVVFANRLISATTGVHLHDYGCPLKVYRADVVRDMSLYGDLYRFIPAIASWQGVQIAEVEVRGRRDADEPVSVGVLSAIRVLLDLITVRFMLGYAARPMQSFGRIGCALLLATGPIGLYLAYIKLILGQDIGDRPLLLLAMLLALVGIQFLVLGLLAELITRVYYEVQHKPIYVVREIIEGGEVVKE